MAQMPDLDRLKSQLLTSGLQQRDFPLFQVIDQLIQALRQTITTVDDALGTGGSGGGSAFGQTFTTVQNEKATLPNSRQLTAGTGIQLNDTFNRLIINSVIPLLMGDSSGDNESGEMGPPGMPGPAGMPGIVGMVGPIGPMGMDGNDGDAGEIGPPGMTGPRGLTGPAGSGSAMPYWFDNDEFNYPETLPQISLNSPQYINAPWTFNKAPTLPALSIPETAIIDGTLLARNAANETITGGWTFNSPGIGYNFVDSNVFFTHPFPQFFFIESGVAVDNTTWRILIDGGVFYFGTMDDARTSLAVAIQTTRSGNTVQSTLFNTNGVQRLSIGATGTVAIGNALQLYGRSTVTLSADQTAWNPSGLGTIFHLVVNPTVGPWTVYGILAQVDGYIITISNNTTINFIIVAESASASAANRIIWDGSTSTTISAWRSFTLIYDGSVSRWRVISRT